MSQLSDSTISKLADTLVSDVIDYINEDERLRDFYLEVIGDALCEKLGNKRRMERVTLVVIYLLS